MCVMTVDSMYLSEVMSQLGSIDDVTELLKHCQASIFTSILYTQPGHPSVGRHNEYWWCSRSPLGKKRRVVPRNILHYVFVLVVCLSAKKKMEKISRSLCKVGGKSLVLEQLLLIQPNTVL